MVVSDCVELLLVLLDEELRDDAVTEEAELTVWLEALLALLLLELDKLEADWLVVVADWVLLLLEFVEVDLLLETLDDVLLLETLDTLEADWLVLVTLTLVEELLLVELVDLLDEDLVLDVLWLLDDFVLLLDAESVCVTLDEVLLVVAD